MAANIALNRLKPRGWTAGFMNLFERESDWWKTRRGLIQLIVWILIINGLLFSVLNAPAQPSESNVGSPLQQAAELFCVLIGFICPVAIMVASQGSIVGEKQNGTAAWILSKPVSRTAFILSKFMASSLRALVTMILLPGLCAYFLMIGFGLSLQIGAMLEGLGLLFLNILFFQSFTFMMGTLANSRRTVIGASLALVFILNLITNMSISSYLPGHLPLDAAIVLTNQPYTNLIPLVETIVMTILFLSLGFWRFAQEEF